MKIKIKGLTGGKDRRGFASITGKFLFTETTVDEALTGALPVNITSLPESNRKFAEWIDDASFVIDVTFEGIVEEPTEDEDQYVILPEWRDEPIEGFPDMKKLEDVWGAFDEDGRIKFPQFAPGGSTDGGSGLGGSNAGAAERNPLYGTTTYPVLRIVAQQSFVRRRIPASIYNDIGKVVKNLPAGFENPPKGPFIVDVPRLRKRKGCWEIVRVWKDIERLKNYEALYTLLQRK